MQTGMQYDLVPILSIEKVIAEMSPFHARPNGKDILTFLKDINNCVAKKNSASTRQIACASAIYCFIEPLFGISRIGDGSADENWHSFGLMRCFYQKQLEQKYGVEDPLVIRVKRPTEEIELGYDATNVIPLSHIPAEHFRGNSKLEMELKSYHMQYLGKCKKYPSSFHDYFLATAVHRVALPFFAVKHIVGDAEPILQQSQKYCGELLLAVPQQ